MQTQVTSRPRPEVLEECFQFCLRRLEAIRGDIVRETHDGTMSPEDPRFLEYRSLQQAIAGRHRSFEEEEGQAKRKESPECVGS